MIDLGDSLRGKIELPLQYLQFSFRLALKLGSITEGALLREIAELTLLCLQVSFPLALGLGLID